MFMQYQEAIANDMEQPRGCRYSVEHDCQEILLHFFTQVLCSATKGTGTRDDLSGAPKFRFQFHLAPFRSWRQGLELRYIVLQSRASLVCKACWKRRGTRLEKQVSCKSRLNREEKLDTFDVAASFKSNNRGVYAVFERDRASDWRTPVPVTAFHVTTATRGSLLHSPRIVG